MNKLLTEWDNASCDEDEIRFSWDMFTEGLTEILDRIFPKGEVACKVKCFGWRGCDGFLETFKFQNGSGLLNKILPQAECTFKIHERRDSIYGHHLAIQNFHHDSPVGNEWYYVARSKYATQIQNEVEKRT